MESRASSSCWLCGRRRGGRLALSAGIAWPRFRRDAVGPGLAGVVRAEQMNSLKEIRRIAGRGAFASRRSPGGARGVRSMADSTGPRCQHGMAATEERRVGRAGVWCDVLTLPMCTESHTLTLHRLPLPVTAQIRRAGGSILRHVPPRSALRLLSSQASSPQQHSSPSALSGSFATSCVPSSRLGSR